VRNDDDEDIVQDSFLKAYKAQKSFRGNEAKTWMLTTVRNTAMDFLRRYKSSTTMTLDEPGYEPEDNSPDPERILLEQSRRDQARQRISHLRGEIAIPFLELELAQRIRHGSRCDCRGDFDCFDPDAAKRQGNRRSSRRNSRQPPAVSRRSIGWMRRARISTPSSRSFRARLIFHRRFRISPRKTSSSSEGASK
jgi:hypothetical protein